MIEDPYDGRLSQLVPNIGIRFCERLGVKFPLPTRLATVRLSKIKHDFVNNYLIVDAGKLIGKNIDLSPKEKDREEDIYIPTPRQFDWVVNIEIPKGYTIENVDNFNLSVENSTGRFVSEAR